MAAGKPAKKSAAKTAAKPTAKRPAKTATKSAKTTGRRETAKKVEPVAPKRAAVKAVSAPKAPAPKASAKAPASARVSEEASAKKPVARRPPGSPPIQKTRVVIPMDVYEPHKDTVKAPFKEHEMKWNFLGEGKGLYKRPDNGVHCFVQFKDDGVHYSIWGDDKPRVEKILGAWRAVLGEEGWKKATTSGEQAVAAEKEEAVSDAMRLWKLAEPRARPGEPDLFLKKRIAEWQAKKPA